MRMVINVYISKGDEELFEELRRVAVKQGTPVSTLIADAVRALLDRPDQLTELRQRLDRIEERLYREAYSAAERGRE